MRKIIKTLLTSLYSKILLVLLACYLAFSYWAVNPLAQRLLPWVAEQQLASRLQFERVAFDPWRLTVTIDQLQLQTRAGAPLAGFEQLFVDLQADSLWRWAWHLKEVRLRAPQATLEIAADESFNWGELLAKLSADDSAPSDTMVRMLIDHIALERGHVVYQENNRPTPFKVVLQPLGLELDGLSTLPADRGDYALLARFPEQGGTLKWKGSLGLNPIASSGDLEISGIRLARLMQLVPDDATPLRVTDGALDTRLRYRFAMVKGAAEPFPQGQVENLQLKLEHVAATLQAAGEPQGELALAQLDLQLPQLTFARPGDVQLALQQLAVNAQQFALKRQDKPLFALDAAEVTGVDFDWNARSVQVAQVLLTGGALHSRRERDGTLDWQQLAVALAGEDNAPAGAVEPEAGESSDSAPSPFHFAVQQVQLAHWRAEHQDQGFTHPLTLAVGNLDLAFAVANDDGAPRIDALQGELGAIALRSAQAPQPLATLDKIRLQQGAVDVAGSSARLAALTLSGLKTQLLRAADGSLDWQTALTPVAAPGASGASGASGATASSTAAGKAAWRFAIDRAALENAALRIEDRSQRQPMRLDIEQARLELRQLSTDLGKPLPLDLALRVKQGGTLTVSGKLTPQPLRADVQLKLDALALAPFSPYLNQLALLQLNDGRLQVNGKLGLRAEKSLSGSFDGGFSLRQLAIVEEQTAQPFISWQELASSSVKFALAPLALHLDELRIVQPDGKFIIHEDGSMNVQRLLRETPGAAPAADKPADAAPPLALAVERVSIENGSLEFADLTLRPQFGTHINTLTGVINGLSNDAAASAQVELDGRVDEYGSARIRGSVQPFRATDFTDLKLAFHNLEMNRLTPYSGKFAGRRIDSGKLSVDLEYKIKARQLAGENKFVINQLRLGERVDSPDAMHLPLDLAIALLEDSNGLIDLDLPISGSLDDPQFSYGKIIWKAVVNVLTKIVTSPFRALGKLLGIDSASVQQIGFDPGAAALAPQQQEKLKSLAQAMNARPALTLKLLPAFDPVADKQALQEQAVRRAVLAEMDIALQPDEQPGPVDVANPKAQSAIDRLLQDRAGQPRGSKTVSAIKDYFRKSRPEDLPVYQEKLTQLRDGMPLEQPALETLAQARANAMRDYLTTKAGLSADRVEIAAVAAAKSDGAEIVQRLELGVGKMTAPATAVEAN